MQVAFLIMQIMLKCNKTAKKHQKKQNSSPSRHHYPGVSIKEIAQI